ncbi:MAG: hypothetical protein K0R26_2368 [Bacteroidota bacterium]|nr:hypothetical protein [Bacteroidota bacterium]
MRSFLHSYLFVAALGFFSSGENSLLAQVGSSASWTKKFEFQKSFIENKGQFVIPASFGNDAPVLFAVDHGGTKIYFTKKGIIYTFIETTKKKKDAREMERERREEFRNPDEHMRHEKEEHQLNVKDDQVNMFWHGGNPDVEIEGAELTSDYHSYSLMQEGGGIRNINNIKGYRKITYKSIYPKIDVEYIFSDKEGLKYSVILHPGADPSNIKMVYDSQVSLKGNGNIHIRTKLGDIIDHAPLTFLNDNKSSTIPSAFVKSGKTVSFQLGNYDNSKTVIIDPWTQTPAFTNNWDCVWECEKDGAGNVYLIGGTSPLQLLKYNAAGAIQWTYNTPYDTTSWLGTFATDNAGISYVTNGTSAGIQKVSTAGGLIWSVGGSSLAEYWNIAFNCDQTKLIVGGTDNLRGAIYDINTTNGAVLSTKIVAYGSAFGFPPSIQEVRSITSCGNGKYYFLTLDTIGFINQNFSSCGGTSGLYKTNSTHGFSYKCENFRYDNTGIMAIRADMNFVYTHNGTTLYKRSLANGSIIASVAIPGGAATTSLGQKAVSCSGIDIDAAGNIYVGSTNAVTKFSSALVQLATVAVPFNVYDVHVSTSGDVIACGSTGNSGTASRTGYIQSFSSLTAGATLSLTCCDVSICQPPSQCTTGAPINLTAASAGGTWSGTGITNATNGTFNPATAGAGTHVITYSLACGSGTTSIVVTTCGTISLCVNSGSLSVVNGTSTYTWSSTTTSVDCSGCPFGNCAPFVCAGVTVPTWTASGTTVSAPSSTVFPIKVKDLASGITYTFTTLASIPSCSTPTCPTLTMAVTSQTNVNCFGASTGSASVNTSGGAVAYSYTWSPGNLTGATQFNLAAGIYTIAIKDQNQCSGTGTVSITQPASALNAVITATTAASCGSGTTTSTFWTETFGTGCNQGALASAFTGTNGAWTVTNTGTNDASANQWYVSATESGMAVGVCGDGCLGAGSTNRTLHVGNVSTSPAAFLFCPAGDCGAAYDTGLGSNAVSADKRAESPTINCTGKSNITLTFKYIEGGETTVDDATLWYFNGTTWAQIDNMPKTVVCGGSQGEWALRTITLPASANNNASIKIGYRWVNNDNGAGSDPSFAVDDITLSSAGSSGGTGGATVTASGGTAGYSYNWAPTGGTSAGATGLTAGSNTVTVTDANGCTATAIANISSSGGPLLSVTSQTNVNCFGANTGTATVGGTGGTGVYTFTWTPGNLTGATQTSLSAGVYTVQVADANNCIGSGTLSISQPSTALTAAISASTAPGCGSSNGTATVTANGGTPGYTYSWTPNGGSGSSASNLTAGPNSVLVTDSKGCSVTLTLNLNSTSGPTISVVSQASVSCFGASTGSATINATGGSSAYSYTWSPGNLTGSTQNSLAAGIYTIVVRDGSGCTGSGTISITQPSLALSAPVFNSPTGCGTSVGSATVTPSGGTPGYTYSWSPSGANTAVISNLSAGNYTVKVTDANGCQTTSVTTINGAAGGPTLSVTSQTNLTCFGASNGGASINATSGSGPYTYTWLPSGGSSPSATGLTAGVYTVFVGYGSGCINTITLNITQPAAISLSLSTTPATCGNYDGTASVLASGGTGALSVLWSVNSNSNTVTGLSAGVYTVTVTDGAGCSVSSTCYVSSSGVLSVDAGIGATIFAGESAALNGTVPVGSTVVWTPSVSLSCSTCTNTIASPNVTTTYTLTTISGGCIGTDTVTIVVDIKCGEVFVPTAFSPNDDGQNDVLYVYGNCIENMEFVIFDRWGEKVFTSNDPAFGWDGTFNGKKMDPAAFAYYLKATVDGEDVIQKGSISIVK